MDPVEAIKARLTIEEVVAPYVQLKKIGRNYKGLCPFHQEKTPSFIVSPDKGLAYCFGCRKGGDIFAFVQEVENIDFPASIKVLADKAGVELPSAHTSKAFREQKDKLQAVLEEAQSFFREQIKKSKTAQAYLEKRGYGADEQARLGLGFAPDSFHELTKVLEKKGYKAGDMLKAGVASQKEVGDSNAYDRFRNRITFPIHSPQGKLVGFGGRTLAKDDSAKYLNSPETELYHKGRSLYCYHLAKKAIREQDQAIVVEGYFDALTAHLKGFPQTVASLGTALTEDQIKLLSRFTQNILFAFDADTSGQTAASRSIEIAQRLGLSVKVILIPSGKDPDDALRSDPVEWEKAVHEAMPAMDYEIQKAFAATDSSSIEGKKTILAGLLPIIKRLPNALEVEHYLKRLAVDLGTSLRSVVSEWNKTKDANLPKKAEDLTPESMSEYRFSRSELLLGLLSAHPELCEDNETLKTALKGEYFPSEKEKNLYKSLVGYYNHADKKKSSVDGEDVQETAYLQLLGLYADDHYGSFSDADLEKELQALCAAIRNDYKRHRLQALRFQMAKHEGTPPADLLEETNALLADRF